MDSHDALATPPRSPPVHDVTIIQVKKIVVRELVHLCAGGSADERGKHGIVAMRALIDDGLFGDVRGAEFMDANLLALAVHADAECAAEIVGIIDRSFGNGTLLDVITRQLLTPGSPLRKKARFSLAEEGHDEDTTDEDTYTEMLFNKATVEYLWDMVVPRIRQEARQVRKKALCDMVNEMKVKMRTPGTSEHTHCESIKDATARSATERALAAFKDARRVERERTQHRLEKAQQEKAAALARLELIRTETAALDDWVAKNGHVDDEWSATPENAAPAEAAPTPACSTDPKPARRTRPARR